VTADEPHGTDDGGPVRDRVPSNVRLLLGANLVSSLGSGFTLPFLLIYLHDVRHIPLGITGLLIGAAAVVGVPVGPVAGALVDRFGARRICAVALCVSAAGAFGLIGVHDALTAVPVLIVIGFGQSSMWPTWNALFARLVPAEGLRPRVFARSFQLMNLGLGAGALIAGVVVHVSDPGTFTLIYVVDGLTYLVLVVALLALPGRSGGPTQHPHTQVAPASGTGGFREVFADRRFRRYLVASSILAFAGYSAVDAGFVGYANHVVHAGSDVIAWAFGLNTGLIVLVQPVGLAVAARLRRTTSLMLCAAFFGVSWAVLLGAGSFPRSGVGDLLVIVMFGVFSLGEVLLSPVGFPLVSMMASPELQGRYNATATSVYTTMNVVGPSVAGVMLGAGLDGPYLALLMAAAAVAMTAFWRLRRVLTPAIDNAPAGRDTPAAVEEPAGSGLESPSP
jgi:MFS family permease